MELEFELLEQDYINFNIDHAKKASALKKNILMQRILGPIIFSLFPFIIRMYTEILMWYWVTIFGILSVSWYVFYPKYFNWEMARRLKKMLKEGNNENILIQRKIRLSEQGILETSPIGETNISWSQVDKVEETDEYIYIYISSISAHIIPKRVFSDEDEKQMFMRVISKYYDLQITGQQS